MIETLSLFDVLKCLLTNMTKCPQIKINKLFHTALKSLGFQNEMNKIHLKVFFKMIFFTTKVFFIQNHFIAHCNLKLFLQLIYNLLTADAFQSFEYLLIPRKIHNVTLQKKLSRQCKIKLLLIHAIKKNGRLLLLYTLPFQNIFKKLQKNTKFCDIENSSYIMRSLRPSVTISYEKKNAAKLLVGNQKYINYPENVLKSQASLLQQDALQSQGNASKTFSSNTKLHSNKPTKYKIHHGPISMTDSKIIHFRGFGQSYILYSILQKFQILLIYFKKRSRVVLNKNIIKKSGIKRKTIPRKDIPHLSWVLHNHNKEKTTFSDSQNVDRIPGKSYDNTFTRNKLPHHLTHWIKETLARQKKLNSKNKQYKKKIETYKNSAYTLQTQLDKQERKLQDLKQLLRQERREKIKLEKDCQRLLSKILELKWIKVPPPLVEDTCVEKTIEQCDASQPPSHSFFHYLIYKFSKTFQSST